jgi:hypothetical protein
MKKLFTCILKEFKIISLIALSLCIGNTELLSQSFTLDHNMDLISNKGSYYGVSKLSKYKSNDSCFRIGIIATGVYQEPANRLSKVGFNSITFLDDTSGLSEFVKFDIIYLPTNWAGLGLGSLDIIESNSNDYINYLENGGNIYIEQPNPYGQPGDSIRPTIIPYPITFHNSYDYQDFPPVAIDSSHEITKDIIQEDLPFPGDSMTFVDDHYQTLVVGATSLKPSLVITEFGLGKLLVCTAHPSPNALYTFGDEIYIRMINWLVKREYTTEPITECVSYTWIDGITYTESNNTATYTLTNVNGCDSIIKLDLTIIKVDTSVYLRNDTIFSSATDADYQWLNCDGNFEIIHGENDQSYIPNESGNYAVKVFQNNCIDTSSCIYFSPNAIHYPLLNELKIYPNPTEGQIFIDLSNLKRPAIKIYNALGLLVHESFDIKEKLYKYNIKGGSGLYIVVIILDSESRMFKIFRK